MSRLPHGLRSKFLPLVCGALGAAGALLYNVVAAPPVAPAREEVSDAPASVDDERLSALERRVSALGAPARHDAPLPVTAVATDDGVDDPITDEEQARERGRQERDALLERHEAERIDPGWAPKTESALTDDFATIAKRAQHAALDVIDVDCRSHMCKVRVEWGSYDEAVRTAEKVAMHAFAENCPVWVFVPEPESASSEARYQHDVVLDCSG